MIKSISGGQHVVVSGSNMPYISNYGNGAVGIGNLRFNTQTQNIEVYDGVNWITVSNYTGVDLSPVANAAVNWAITKMAEERELEKLAKDNRAVKIAYEQMLKAKEQLKTTIILSKDEQTTS